MRVPFTALAVALSLAQAPIAWGKDARLITRMYNPDEVVAIEGRAGVQATISFAEDEHIENVAIGDSNSWQVTPNKRANVLFVKPLAPRGRTNLTVITDRHTYLFDLIAGGQGRPIYVLRFTYPEAPKATVAAASAASMTDMKAQAAIRPPLDAVVDPAQLNFAWRRQGNAKLLPERVYDDGNATFVKWEARAQLPAILVRNEKGEEGAVNYAVRDGVIVIDGVPKTILLRAGRDLATLENQAPPKASAPAPAKAAGLIVEQGPTTLPTEQTERQ